MGKLFCAAALLVITAVPASAFVYYGEVAAFAFKYCPQGWEPAWGQKKSVGRDHYLFPLLQREYGSDDAMSFRVPELHEHPPTLPAEGARDRAKLTWCIRTENAVFPPRGD